MTTTSTAPPPPSLRSIALPAEHGAWGLLLEPLALGLLVAGSWAGAAVAIAAVLAFLARQPLRLALTDWLRGRPGGARARLALRVAAVELVGAGLAFAVAWRLAPAGFWLPLAVSLPLAGLQFSYDVRLRGRGQLPELLGAIAAGAVASSLAWAGGWPPAAAWPLWLLMAARAAPSVLFVRTRLRLDRDVPTSVLPSHASHVAALALVCGLGAAQRVPWLAGVPYAVLLVRGVIGLGRRRRKLRPQALGAMEVALGALTVLLLALAYALG